MPSGGDFCLKYLTPPRDTEHEKDVDERLRLMALSYMSQPSVNLLVDEARELMRREHLTPAMAMMITITARVAFGSYVIHMH